MNPDFSERQFEAAVNIELTLSLGPHMSPAIPVVPTTNQEAKEGWDALFKLGSGYWYFLQYKTVVSASRRTQWNKAFWDVHGCPYFRFPFHVDSKGECRQHRLLSELRQTQPGVYYCVPAFVKEDELWLRSAARELLEGSRLFDVADLLVPSYLGDHQVSFDDSGLVQVWSERGKQSREDRLASIRRTERNRRQINRGTIGELLADVSRIAGSSRRARGRDALEGWVGARFPESLRDIGLELADEHFSERMEPEDLLTTTSRILQLDFGLTWVIDPVGLEPDR